MIDPYGWKLTHDEEGRIIVIPIENPLRPVGGEPRFKAIRDRFDLGEDPEHERAKIAGLAR